MKPLDEDQQAELVRRLEADPSGDAGSRRLLGAMFAVEGAAGGAALASAAAVAWPLGAVAGLAAVGAAWAGLLRVPRERRLAWTIRMWTPRR